MNQSQSNAEALSKASKLLFDNNITNSYNEAMILLSHAGNITKEQLISNLNESITGEVLNKFMSYVTRRVKHEPIAYIIGYKEFWSLEFAVSNKTLIPRSDSEILVESVLKYCSKEESHKILDLGTGSGCLLLATLHELPKAHGTGIDISEDALEIAKINASNLNLSARVNFINTAWKDFSLADFNLIISNPPYIEKHQIQTLQQEVHFEPIMALDGGIDGKNCYREIILLLPRIVSANFKGFFEIGYGQSEAICGLLEKAGFYIIEIARDLAEVPRIVIFTNNPKAKKKFK